jgi:ABC-type multidrug transport system fused ATPase/permease subunit
MPSKAPSQADRTPLRDLPHYLRVFRGLVGVRLYFVLVLSVLSALSESLGIVLLLPLLTIFLDSEDPVAGGLGGAVREALEWLGLASSPAWLLVLIANFLILKALFQFAALGYASRLRARLLKQLRLRLLAAFSRMSYSYYVSRHTGHFTNLINGQVNISAAAFSAVSNLAGRAAIALAYVAAAFLVDWFFGGIAVVAGVAIFLAFQRLSAYVREMARATAAEQSVLAKLVIQGIQSFKYIRATDQSHALERPVNQSLDRLIGFDLRKNLAADFTNAVREPIGILTVMAIVGIYVVALGASLAPVIVAVLLFYRALNAVLQMQVLMQQGMNSIGGLELVRDELALQAQHQEPDGAVPIPTLRGSIRLQQVSFSYHSDAPPVLDEVSLDIPCLSSVAFVGPSGAGKSTLADVLTLMLKPTSGRVLIDGVPGEQVRLSSWRRQIGYVSQETVVFDDTVANNICMWSGDPSRDADLARRVRQAAECAHFAEVIETLPEGYDTRIGDRGVRLSGGQRQRLFIARELFRSPQLLILDEATSALDSESERKIQQSIDDLKGTVTVVMIAHRLSTIRNADLIFVLDRGRVVEQGGYEELRARADSRLGELIRMQAL